MKYTVKARAHGWSPSELLEMTEHAASAAKAIEQVAGLMRREGWRPKHVYAEGVEDAHDYAVQEFPDTVKR